MSGTARLGIPFISAGQAQKEFTHNEALQLIDIVVVPAVEEVPGAEPPASPVIGACYIVGSPATGDWIGHDHGLACFSSGGWRVIPAIEGMTAFVKSVGAFATYLSSGWEIGILRGTSVHINGTKVIGPRAAAIPDPVGGA